MAPNMTRQGLHVDGLEGIKMILYKKLKETRLLNYYFNAQNQPVLTNG